MTVLTLSFMATSQHDKSTSKIIVEILEYVPDSITHKTVIKKHAGTFSTSSQDTADSDERKSSYDNFLQVVEGLAQVRINNTDHDLSVGQTLHVLPNHVYSIHSRHRFKMIITIVKPEK